MPPRSVPGRVRDQRSDGGSGVVMAEGRSGFGGGEQVFGFMAPCWHLLERAQTYMDPVRTFPLMVKRRVFPQFFRSCPFFYDTSLVLGLTFTRLPGSASYDEADPHAAKCSLWGIEKGQENRRVPESRPHLGPLTSNVLERHVPVCSHAVQDQLSYMKGLILAHLRRPMSRDQVRHYQSHS